MENRIRSDEAFSRTLAAHQGRIRQFVRRLLPDWGAVDDVVQEVCVVMWAKNMPFGSDDEFLRLSYGVARYEVMRYRRGVARSRLVFDPDLIGMLCQGVPEGGLQEGLAIQDASLLSCLVRCVDRLSPQERELVVDFYTVGHTAKSIERSSGVPASRVYKTVRRIREKLRACVCNTRGRADA